MFVFLWFTSFCLYKDSFFNRLMKDNFVFFCILLHPLTVLMCSVHNKKESGQLTALNQHKN